MKLFHLIFFFTLSIFFINNIKATTHDHSHEKEESLYVCPMHPEVIDSKKSRCPLCGMPLVKKEKETTNKEKNNSFSITEYQKKLINIQSYTVTKKDLNINRHYSGKIISKREVAFIVHESEFFDLKIGSHFTGEMIAHKGYELEGVITSIDTFLDPITKTVRAIGTFKESLRQELNGASFLGEIHLLLKDVLTIPVESVIHGGLEDIVYVVNGNKLTYKSVKLGNKNKEYFEVIEGLKPNDIILRGPNFLIDSEAKIRGLK